MANVKKYDYIIIGAGIYGTHAALNLARKKRRVALLEHDAAPFSRATFINQARLHNGYHYPRSFSTAIKSAGYFERFYRDYSYAINDSFKKIYAISSKYSLTSAEQFERFCVNAGIPCERIDPGNHFNPGTVEAAFETREYAIDAFMIRDRVMAEIAGSKFVDLYFSVKLGRPVAGTEEYTIELEGRDAVSAPAVINATYAGTNQILDLFGFDKFKIKYEICEIIVCDVTDNFKDAGITVMDGPFFSLMPFGKAGKHTLTSVMFTPHLTSYETLPVFPCQSINRNCTPATLQNCNGCPAMPETSWKYMSQLARKYLSSRIGFNYEKSLFAIKPILKASEADDSRPTLVKTFSKKPLFISVLSGKINTLYDMESCLE